MKITTSVPSREKIFYKVQYPDGLNGKFQNCRFCTDRFSHINPPGLSAKLKAIVWRIFLNETGKPDMLKDLSYTELCKYANLMIKILTGKPVSADEPWYPEK